MAHWCFQLLCILKTRMSWKSLCLLFFISNWVLFSRKDSLSTLGGGGLKWEMGMVATETWSPVLCCHWNSQCRSLLLRIAARLKSYSESIVTQHFSHSSPPSLLITTNHHCHTSIRGFWSHLTLRTWTVCLILTKINLLFSRWILCACKCCDCHIP